MDGFVLVESLDFWFLALKAGILFVLQILED